MLPGEVITAKANARMMSAIPNTQLGNCFMLMDLHTQGLLQVRVCACACVCVRTRLWLCVCVCVCVRAFGVSVCLGDDVCVRAYGRASRACT